MSPRSLQATIDEQPAIAAPAPSAGPRALARWLQLGADPTASAGETRRVVMVNTLALVSFGITLIYVSLYLFMSWWGPLALTVVALCCYGLVFQCHRSGFMQLAPRLLMATAIGHLSALSTLFLSGHAGVHLYLLVVLPFTFMTVRASDRVGRGLILSGALIGLAFCELQPLFGDPPYLVAVSKAELGIFHSVCVISLSVFLTVICASFGRELFVAQKRLKVQHARSESLLLSILPAPIAERLKADEAPIADDHAAAAVLFADVVGFTSLAATLEARDLVAILARYFVAYDHLAVRHGVEKIKTIGDAYMAASGVPEPCDDAVERCVEMAKGMLVETARLNGEHGQDLALRIGVHVGPVTAGVIGEQKFIYDLWGDTVNLASRMESTGLPGRVQVTEEVTRQIGEGYRFSSREGVVVKGKGTLNTYLLEP